jgi:hypothetical protein
MWAFKTMGCTHGCYWTRLQRLGQSYTLCSFVAFVISVVKKREVYAQNLRGLLVFIFKSVLGEKTSKVSLCG